MTRLILLATLGVAVAVLGCSSSSRPDGMPVLHPCSLTITQGNTPLEGVSVYLHHPTISKQWSISGTTNATGVAVMQTHGRFPGVPAGTFKVVVAKNESEGGFEGDGIETPRVDEGPQKIYSLIEEKYLKEETTPHQLDVNSKTSRSFDVGAPVRVLLQTIDSSGT